MVKDGEEVKQGQPMFVMDIQVRSSLAQYTERHKSNIKKIVGKLSAGVGTYRVEDVLWKQDDVENSPMAGLYNEEYVLKRYEKFKKFDYVWDYSDHLFSAQPMRQPAKDWAERLRGEWLILEQQLPETIYVRAYRTRMDLLRAVIVGPQGTPYHDGLFFFDVFFSSNYPYSPPLVRYHSGGFDINPNVYKCGEVDLRRVASNGGKKVDIWVPGASNMLQLLLSIQALILNKKPYFSSVKPVSSTRTVIGELMSLMYSENTYVKSLKTMVHTMNRPPTNFENLVVGHFHKHVCDILMACKAYIEGVQVGCFGCGVREKEGIGSIEFRNDVASCIKPLVDAFNKIGAKEAEKFLALSEKTTPLPAAGSEPTPDVHRSYTYEAPYGFLAVRVLVKTGMKVKAGAPLFVAEKKPPKDCTK